MSDCSLPFRLGSLVCAVAVLLGFARGIAAEEPAPAPATPTADERLDARLDEQIAKTGNLLSNGDFEKLGSNSWPEGWGNGPSKGMESMVEDGKRFMRLTQTEAGKLHMLYRIIPLRTGTKGMTVTIRYRTDGVKRGSQMPGDARVVSHFISGSRSGRLEDGEKLKPTPPTLGFSSNAKEWTEVSKVFLVPDGATKLQLMPGLWFAKAGTVDIASIRIEPMTAADVEALAAKQAAELAAAQAQKEERERILAEILALPSTSSALRVEGNQVLDADGQPRWLQGLCVDSLQWSMGENILWSIRVAMDEWKANVIRLPVNEAFWFGRGKGQPTGGEEAYRKTVDEAVRLVGARGGHLVLDLHSFGSPSEKHRAFWLDAGARYANNPTVLFELFNEAHGISWKLWRDGGRLDGEENVVTDVNAAENDEKVEGKTTIGMQALVDAVRGLGAKNVLVVGGLDWAYDLSGIVDGYALNDTTGNGIIYVSHIYPWKKDWEKKVLVAVDRFPIILTELGCQPNPMPWQKTTEDPATFAPDMLGLIQKYRLHWTGFSFHPSCAPRAILDWNYTPTPYWGAYAKDALAGKEFTLQRLR